MGVRLAHALRLRSGYNRRRTLVQLPLRLAILALGVHALVTDSVGSDHLLLALLALVVGTTLVDLGWWLLVRRRHPDANIPF
jgi:hypothetical protein